MGITGLATVCMGCLTVWWRKYNIAMLSGICSTWIPNKCGKSMNLVAIYNCSGLISKVSTDFIIKHVGGRHRYRLLGTQYLESVYWTRA